MRIDWSDFASGYSANEQGYVTGGGEANAGEVAELNKALSAGASSPVFGDQTAGAARPLMPESLDNTLYSLTYDQEECPFWKMVSKQPAYNTVEEYNRLHKVGQGEAAFIGEGDLPEEEDSTYSREVTLIKFMGVTRRVTHVASLVKTAGVANAIAAETRDGTIWLMRQLEEALFFGDSNLIPVQFDGLRRLMIDGGTPTYDLRGGVLTEEILNGMTGVVRQAPNYGKIDTLFMSVGVKSDLVNQIKARARAQFGDQIDMGATIDEMSTQNGKIRFKDNVFILEGQAPHASGLGKVAKRPLPPIVTGAITSPADATGQFAAGDAGNYYYKIVAQNRFGRSTPVTTALVAIAAGDRVDIPVQDGGQDATCYILYRSAKNGAATTCKEMIRIKRTALTQTLQDFNADLPGCSEVYGLSSQPACLGWLQLAPFTKIPLSTIDLSIRWMQVLYGALQLRKPRHFFRLKNVGRDPNSPIVASSIIGFE